jgi:predicted RNase H-like nuclease (RuvC/YqgF family)
MMNTKPSHFCRAALTALALALLAANVQAQSNSKKDEKPERPAQEQKAGKDQDKDAVVDHLAKDFKQKADEYQAKQKDLVAALKNSSGNEKEKVRATLKALQEEFKEEKEKFRDQVNEAKDKVADLKKKLDEEAKEAREKGKPRDR